MLTQEQSQRSGRHIKLYNYLTYNQEKVDTKELLKDAVEDYGDILEKVDPEASKKAKDSTGITQTKEQAKDAVALYYEEICGDATLYCTRKKGDFLALRPGFKFSRDRINKIKDLDLMGFATGINETVTEKILSQADGAKSGITAAILNKGLALASTFKSKIGGAKGVDAGKTAANTEIDKLIELLDDVVEFEIEPGMKKFKTSDPSFYSGFVAINRIDDIGHNATGIAGDVTFEGQPISGGVITIEGITKTDTSDLTGRYDIRRFSPGTYQVTCTHPTHGVKTQVVVVKLGKMVEVDWEY